MQLDACGPSNKDRASNQERAGSSETNRPHAMSATTETSAGSPLEKGTARRHQERIGSQGAASARRVF
jgi:hypothetical protein